jgi:hypothetical protein
MIVLLGRLRKEGSRGRHFEREIEVLNDCGEILGEVCNEETKIERLRSDRHE